MVLAAGLRLLALGSDDYWLDELHSLMNSGGRYAASYALPHGEILYDLERPTDLAAGAGVADARRVRLDRLRRQLTTVSKRRRSRGGRVVKWTVDRLHR